MNGRVILQEDANTPLDLMRRCDLTLDDWLSHRFAWIAGTPVDTIIWDMGLEADTYRVYAKGSLLPMRDFPKIAQWAAEGFDWLEGCLERAARHGITSFWNHRISEVDLPRPWGGSVSSCPWDSPLRENPLKKAHPDWVVPCWWPQGLWNLAHPEVRRHKVAVLRELFGNYSRLAGLQLDFARHTPFLPPGAEWAHRDGATEFVRMVRSMLDDAAHRRGTPVFLAARVAETPSGNRLDGLDVETWAREKLVDAFTLGGRAAAIDFDGYRRLPNGDAIRLWPMLDGHHTPEGYHYPPHTYLRGLFSLWNAQGADGMALFNWIHGNRVDEPPRPANLALLKELSDPERLRAGAKMFAVEGRGEYPWAGNYLYRSDDKPLPVTAAHGGGVILPLEIFPEPVPARLRLLVEGLGPDVLALVSLNETPLEPIHFDPEGEDRYFGFDPKAEKPRYPEAIFAIPPHAARLGDNRVTILFRPRVNPRLFTVRRVEVHTGANP